MERDFKGIWIPKEIWLEKDLNWAEKILLVEISSLDNEDGCWASNAYFAQFLDLSKNRVSVLINNLKDKGYVSVEMRYKKGSKQIEKRIIRNRYTYMRKQIGGICENSDTPICENSDTPICENSEDNNTSFNNTSFNNTSLIKDIEITHTHTKTSKKLKEPKTKYGEYGNVLLTDTEIQKLTEQIPGYESILERLSEYIASTGKKYASHYATIRAWHRRDQEQGKPIAKQKGSAIDEFIKEMEGKQNGPTGFY